MRKATIAIEDRRFFEHGGVDLEGIARAAVADIKAGAIVEGGSTITQQLVRNLYISREQTVQRKVKEACLASKLDGEWTKQRILTEYLNQSLLRQSRVRHRGSGADVLLEAGQRARPLASRRCSRGSRRRRRSTTRSRLRPARSRGGTRCSRAMLDTRRHHAAHLPQDARRRRSTLHRGRLYDAIREPYFFGYVRDKLIEVYGAQSGPLRRAQGLHDDHPALSAAGRDRRSTTRSNESTDPAAALISISPRTGAIRAMAAVVPNRPKNQFNLLSQARRQPGSTFKTFVLTAAVEQGINPDSTYYVSAPFTYKVHPAGNCDDGTWWCVQTYANDYYGWSSIRSATIRSDNSVYAQLTLDVGPQKVAEVARRMGVRSQLDVNGAYVPSIGLGSIAVSPLDLASAYSTLAARGRARGADGDPPCRASGRPVDTEAGWGSPETPPRDLRGNSSDRHAHPRAERPVGNRNARRVRPAGGREDGNERGARRRVVRRVHARARDDRLDRLHERARSRCESVHGIAVSGGSFPAEIWRLFMEPALEGTEPEAFPEPAVWPEWKPFTRGRVRARV